MIGQTLGQYRLDTTLGEGAFGAVYRGVHLHAPTIQAAVKVAHADLAGDATFVAMMHRECEILYSLSHPNIVRFRDLIIQGRTIAVIMDLLEGEDLADRLDRGRLGPDQACDLLEGVLEGLAHAHDRGVLHRDVKPANIFLCDDGRAMLTDFGIAKAAHTTRATQTGMVSGTLDYMAPERFEGHSTPATDVYAVGLLAWELIAGPPACPEGDLATKLGWHMKQGAPELTQVVPDCPPWLSSTIARWTHTDRHERSPDARHALDELRRARAEQAAPLPEQPWESTVAQRTEVTPTLPGQGAAAADPTRPRSILPLFALAGALAGVVAALMLVVVFLALRPLGPELQDAPEATLATAVTTAEVEPTPQESATTTDKPQPAVRRSSGGKNTRSRAQRAAAASSKPKKRER